MEKEKSRQTKKKVVVEGNTDKEKVQVMKAMIEQIENTVSEIWANSYQKDDMIVSLTELKRLFEEMTTK